MAHKFTLSRVTAARRRLHKQCRLCTGTGDDTGMLYNIDSYGSLRSAAVPFACSPLTCVHSFNTSKLRTMLFFPPRMYGFPSILHIPYSLQLEIGLIRIFGNIARHTLAIHTSIYTTIHYISYNKIYPQNCLCFFQTRL